MGMAPTMSQIRPQPRPPGVQKGPPTSQTHLLQYSLPFMPSSRGIALGVNKDGGMVTTDEKCAYSKVPSPTKILSGFPHWGWRACVCFVGLEHINRTVPSVP